MVGAGPLSQGEGIGSRPTVCGIDIEKIAFNE
jgi:hypothetical protein